MPASINAGINFWAGITFDDNNGTTGISLSQLNNIGQLIYNPPTVGSSLDLYFQSIGPGDFPTGSPAGSFLFFNGSPVANFFWEFTVTPVPEPTSLTLLGVVGTAGIGCRRWRKK